MSSLPSHRHLPLTRAALLAAAVLATLALPGCFSANASSDEALAARGYGADAQGVCNAAAKGDVQALRLMSQAGMAARSLVADGNRFCLEAALIGHGNKIDVAAVLDEVKPAKTELDRAYTSATGMTARDVPNAEQLSRAAGYRPASLYAGGQVVEATPLMWAVWSGDQAAVQALLAHGADPNLRSNIVAHVSGKAVAVGGQTIANNTSAVRISASPMFEAQRLQRESIARMLSRRGGKPSVASTQPRA